ncbi:MAG TPA: thioredoxin family protein [Burkholderiaceae bacterium]|nr:thioredoxin family protein [Burkholderiaceae bacterium]
MLKITASFLLSLTLFASSLAAHAGETPFVQSQYEQLIAQGKPVIVDFYADWCPTCKAQKPVVEDVMHNPKLQGVTLFLANYDQEIALKKSLHVTQQSTFVVFKGGKEVTRSTGQTGKADISALFDQAL